MRRRCFRALRKAGGKTGFLPSGYQVVLELKKQDSVPNASGGYSDVWKAISPSGTAFALKVLRVTLADDTSKIRKVSEFVLTYILSALPYMTLSGSVRRCWFPNMLRIPTSCQSQEFKLEIPWVLPTFVSYLCGWNTGT